ncbi:hypothetical protein OSTOST_14513 [Ostertagia ostertagi]
MDGLIATLMDRESRRSKEEEEELDRKIAQIREKNQKIEERQKEIDADRASHADGLQRKTSKPSPPSSGTNKTPKGEWDREITPMLPGTKKYATSAKTSSNIKDDPSTGQNSPAKNRTRKEKGKRKYALMSMPIFKNLSIDHCVIPACGFLLSSTREQSGESGAKGAAAEAATVEGEQCVDETKGSPTGAKSNVENAAPVVASEAVENKNDSKDTAVDAPVEAAAKVESTPAPTTPKTSEAPEVTNTPTTATTEVAAAAPADANQNVIKLVEEKVLQIQMS